MAECKWGYPCRGLRMGIARGPVDPHDFRSFTMTRRSGVRAQPDVVFQKLGDEAVLLNLRTGVYWSLNHTGARIWDEITHTRKVTEIVAALQREFDGSSAEISATVHGLIQELNQQGLVVVDEEQ